MKTELSTGNVQLVINGCLKVPTIMTLGQQTNLSLNVSNVICKPLSGHVIMKIPKESIGNICEGQGKTTLLNSGRGNSLLHAKSQKTKKRKHVQYSMLLNAAVKSGKVIKPTICSKCGKLRKVTAHHDDYSKPLQVKWLCYECHGNK